MQASGCQSETRSSADAEINQRVWGHSRSPNMVSFVMLGMISYYCAIDFVPKKCGFEIFDLQKNVVTLKSGSEVTQGHRN